MPISSASTAARAGSNEGSAAVRRAGPTRLRAELARPPRLGAALALRRLRRLAARLHLGALRGGSRAWRGGSPPPVSPPILAPGGPLPPPPREAPEFPGCGPFLAPPFAPPPPS